jgi:hypothetical protein
MKQLLMMSFLLLASLMLQAAPVTKEKAKDAAARFLQQKDGKSSLRAGRITPVDLTEVNESANNAFFVFNVGQNEGFVIVSGDDRTDEILGYADKGFIDSSTMPDGLRYLLDGYAEQIAWMESHGQGARAATRSGARSPISPLIASRWNQGSPYNNNCPEVESERTVTGCVATAMAQLMYYYKHPISETTAIPGYTTKRLNRKLDGLDPTTFNWHAMTPTYSNNSTGDAANAVAKLMQYCGWSLQMDYNLASEKGSSAYNASIPEALKTYFGYDSGVRSAMRKCYSYQEWVNLIYEELANSRPVILGGQGVGSGHSFVCDGYDVDDYFHINWGWGGGSDGYFRLSALNPYEQGIGGSSSMDGFSYSQDAVIGIQPTGSSSPGYCLLLEGFSFGASDTDASKVYNRNSGEEAFSGIGLYMVLCSYKLGTYSFDAALQLTDAEGHAINDAFPVGTNSMTFNQNWNVTVSDYNIPATVSDGTYYIKVMSKPNESSTWQDSYDYTQYQMTATISGNTLTITAPMPSVSLPTSETITVAEALTVGIETEVIASVTGGSADYHQNLFLTEGNTIVAGKQVDIPAGQTVDVHFTYKPKTAGNKVLKIKANDKEIGSEEVTVAESDATDNLVLGFSATINNQETADGPLYGNAFRASITATNSSTTNSYAGRLTCSVRKWTVTQNGDETKIDWESLTTISQPLVIDKNGHTTLDFAYDGLEKDTRYSFRFTYIKDGEVDDAIHLGLGKYEETDLDVGTITTTDGYRLGDATGATTIHPSSSGIDAGSACFVDLRDLSSMDGVTITPSSNPNCLYLLASDATEPNGLSGCNVVVGSSAGAITLTDGSDFYSPIDFTAQNISYSRTFTLPADGNKGWNSLMVPFTVSTVTCEDIGEVDWFHSASETGKNFWLRAFTADGSNTVTFDYATAIAANTPYIIAVPDDRWGDNLRMTDRTVTFSATNAQVSATKEAYVSGNNYRFCGTTAQKTNLTNVYKLNGTGSKFVKQASTSAGAFRVWFAPVSISSLTQPSLSIIGPETTGLLPISVDVRETKTDSWYSLDGRRLSGKPTAKGIYINNGKKQIIR